MDIRPNAYLKLITNFGVYNVSRHPTLEELAEYAIAATKAGVANDDLIYRCIPIKSVNVKDALRDIK